MGRGKALEPDEVAGWLRSLLTESDSIEEWDSDGVLLMLETPRSDDAFHGPDPEHDRRIGQIARVVGGRGASVAVGGYSITGPTLIDILVIRLA